MSSPIKNDEESNDYNVKEWAEKKQTNEGCSL
jgi:hypothetical protein